MSRPRVLILRAPGTNCDGETAFAFETAGATADVLHVNRVLQQPEIVSQFQILCLPGGFSYGDDIAAGRILGNQLRHHLADVVAEFRDAGKLILGICNGFQVLIKSGILLADLPDANAPHGTAAPATLTWNDSGRFEDRWVRVVTRGDRCVFLRGIERMELPIAHAEGKFIARDTDVLGNLEHAGQLVLRYATAEGLCDAIAYPENPNGSQLCVAGVCDTTGRVLGLMPHPERHLDATNHPRWTRENRRDVGDGLKLFQNAVAYFA